MSSTTREPSQAAVEEYFDVVDVESGAKTGVSLPRSQVHRDGVWHRSTHIWIASRERRAVLLQKRASGKDTFPGRWDVSAAGHISAGDESLPSAERELQEELGIDGEGKLRFLFTARSEAIGETEKHGRFCDRELQDVYIYDAKDTDEVSVKDIVVQEDEVEEVQYWDVDEFRQALANGHPDFVPRSSEYAEQFFPALQRCFDAAV